MVDYLERTLDAWSPDRAAAGDYRILMLDSYKSHFHEDIERVAWEHGYLVLYHYGCTTGVCQINDVALHATFKRIFLDLERADFIRRQYEDPGDISRSRQQVALCHSCRHGRGRL